MKRRILSWIQTSDNSMYTQLFFGRPVFGFTMDFCMNWKEVAQFLFARILPWKYKSMEYFLTYSSVFLNRDHSWIIKYVYAPYLVKMLNKKKNALIYSFFRLRISVAKKKKIQILFNMYGGIQSLRGQDVGGQKNGKILSP